MLLASAVMAAILGIGVYGLLGVAAQEAAVVRGRRAPTGADVPADPDTPG